MKIGIIGGAGAAASNKLMELIEHKYIQKGAFRDCHHPEIILYQASKAPSRSLYLEGRGESFIPEYIDIAVKLKQIGAEKIAMCCNTAHYAIDIIEKEAEIKFFNIIEECVKKAAETGLQKFGLIASDGCLKGRVYEKYFKKILPDAEIIYPDEKYQKMVTKAVCNAKNIHKFDEKLSSESPAYLFKEVQKHLLRKGAGKVITGCTDIRPVYFEQENIDSLEVLAQCIFNETYTGIDL